MNTESLQVFKKSHQLTLDLYQLTSGFPAEEKFGLTSQIRRASSSICANLMEGSHRKSKNEYRRFASMSRGSVGELKYHLLLAKDLKYISSGRYQNQITEINEISKMLYGLVDALDSTKMTHTHTDNPHQ